MLERFRTRLASVDALPQLAVLGLLSGLMAGAVIVAFRLLVENVQGGLLPGGDIEAYEKLPLLVRFLLPALGGLAIGVLFQYLGRSGSVQVGVVHVLERLAHHQGHLPLRNLALQFVSAAMSIISGHSVGREGPGVHLGSASGSLLGQWLHLPNNSIRTLVACGAAASIAASFNTPLAGVIFSMEVILMEYTIAGFTPVILAAVSATALTRFVFGADPAFGAPPLELGSLLELPYLMLMGVLIGALAAVFIGSTQRVAEASSHIPVWKRMTLAGVVTGVIALWVPEIMGIGYDTVNQSLLGEIGMGLLFTIVAFKIIATTVGLGLGLPGSLIGPTLVVGAAAGGALGHIAAMIFPGEVASPGFYAMLGMGAMMGATLQAPLAALMALLELTANPNIILPGMLAVVISCMTSSHLFGRESVFLTLLKARGLDYRSNPVTQSLRRVGVASVLNTSFAVSPARISLAAADAALDSQPLWIAVTANTDDANTNPLAHEPVCLLLAADLARYLSANPQIDPSFIDLLEIPAQREKVACITTQATLQQALETMNTAGVDALCVTHHANTTRRVMGIVTRKTVESHYRD
ncbi:MAG: CBS domain-containing protein [Gammaproteobacteria bacterium]|nr:CBS domain-containing protein [Gammaproteobacteria bacterium]